MAPHLLYPSWIKISYHSIFALHQMTIPTRKFNAGIGSHGFGGYTNWAGSPVETDDMVQALVAAMVELYSAEVIFDQFEAFDMDSPDAAPHPVAVAPITSGGGLDGTPGWFEAVQFTYTWFDTAFNTSKLVLLDAASNNNFALRNNATLSAHEQGVRDAIENTAWAWSSRAGFRPSVLRTLSVGVNDALKKQYPGI